MDYDRLRLIAMEHFSPAWGGSAQKMEAFARHSIGQCATAMPWSGGIACT